MKKKKFILHFAKIDLKSDIPTFETNDFNLLINKLDSFMYGNLGKIVYLISIGDEIYISDCNTPCIKFVTANLSKNGGEIFYQEYPSFQEAYKLALDMREGTSDICYSVETKESPYWEGSTQEFMDSL